MKKLAIAVVFTAGFSFANAQSTDTVKVKVDAAAVIKADSVLNTAVLQESAVEAVKVEDSAVKVEASTKAAVKKERKQEKARAKEETEE